MKGVSIRLIGGHWLFYCLAVSMASGCMDQNNTSKPNSIIGEDERSSRADMSADFVSTLGIVDLGDRSCQGFVIATQQIMTAAHCLDKQTDVLKDMKFVLYNGHSTQVTHVVKIDARKDVAILAVERQFSQLLPVAQLNVNRELSMTAIDPLTAEVKYSKCRVDSHDEARGAVFYSCDTTPGYSGTAVLQNDRVVAIHVGYSKELNQNVASDLSIRVDSQTSIRDLAKLNVEWGPHIRIPTPHVPLPNFPDAGLSDALKGISTHAQDTIKNLLSGIDIGNWHSKVDAAMAARVDDEIDEKGGELTNSNCEAKLAQDVNSIIAPVCALVTVALTPVAGGTCLAYGEAGAAAAIATGCRTACYEHKLKGCE